MKRNRWKRFSAVIAAAALCLLSLAGAEEPAENITGTGSTGRVFSVRKTEDGGYQVRDLSGTAAELPELGEIMELIGETGEVMLVARDQNTTGSGYGTGSGLDWIAAYLQAENQTGTGSNTGTVYSIRKKEGGGYQLLYGDQLSPHVLDGILRNCLIRVCPPGYLIDVVADS